MIQLTEAEYHSLIDDATKHRQSVLPDNVVPIDCITRLDLDVGTVLGAARKAPLTAIVVMGWGEDGKLYFASSYADGGSVLWLIEKCKKELLDIEVPG